MMTLIHFHTHSFKHLHFNTNSPDITLIHIKISKNTECHLLIHQNRGRREISGN